MARASEEPWQMSTTPSTPDQRRAAGLRVVAAMAEASQRRPHQESPQFFQPAPLLDLLLDGVGEPLHQTFAALEQDVPGEPVSDHHVELPSKNVPSLDVAEVVEAGGPARGATPA